MDVHYSASGKNAHGITVGIFNISGQQEKSLLCPM